ncbi:hypothetical protein AB0M45_18185 [Nocardia sp. NPDC051787]|uniref:hypothetical protein n=1 Tax=Nocardia sp. NPDC051787 TaxID=3155415 RepID=UPI0034375DC6
MHAAHRRSTRLLFLLVDRTKNVSGFGDFDMAKALQGKFISQGHDLDTAIREEIEMVKDMQEVMRLSLSRLVGQDVDNAGNIVSGTQSLE